MARDAKRVKSVAITDQIHYQTQGQGQNHLVFLHGLMGSAANWRAIAKAFPDNDWSVLMYDQRGHGRSYHPPVTDEGGYRPEDYAADLLNLMDHLGWEEIDLIGHSMGGRNAFVFAALYPDRVKRLVVEDIGPEIQAKNHGNIRRLLDHVPTPFASKTEARQFFQGPFQAKIPENPEAETLAQFFYSNITTVDGGQADWRFSKAGILASVEQGRNVSRWPEWSQVKCPTLLLRGERSEDLSPETYEQMLKENSMAKGVVIPQSGHWIHYEQPQLFIREILSFLAA